MGRPCVTGNDDVTVRDGDLLVGVEGDAVGRLADLEPDRDLPGEGAGLQIRGQLQIYTEVVGMGTKMRSDSNPQKEKDD